MSILILKNVGKRFGKSELFKNVNIELEPSQILTIFGPNASGKSTLLRIIGTLELPTTGVVIIDNKRVNNLSKKEVIALRKNFIGFAFQEPKFLESMSLFDNMLLSLLPLNHDQLLNFRKKVTEILQQFNLENKVYFKPWQLSGGERKRAEIARALIRRPKLVLVDEPTSFVDENSAEIIIKNLTSYCKEESATLVVTTVKDEKLLSIASKKLNILEYK